MTFDMSLSKTRELLRQARSVTVLTGAGISAESGLSTFRGKDGYWKGMSAMELASPAGFARDPRKVWEWYHERRRQLKQAQPNPGHYALAELEARAREFGLITQNVDRLHHAAGSKNLVELHGNIWDVRCSGCEAVWDRTGIELPPEPRCEDCGAWLRPAVVWFGEDLPAEAMQTAMEWTCRAEVFLVVGTSGVVWPAAGLADLARQHGARVIEVNLELPPSTQGAIGLEGKSGEVLPLLIKD